jgi:hypothetical protein
MKHYLILLILGITLGLPVRAQHKSIKQFHFLLGSWEMKNAKGNISEVWKKDGKTLSGRCYKHYVNGDSVLTEIIKLITIDGDLYFSVTGFEKDNKGTTNFKLVSVKEQIFIFENKNHDFPQRIVYENKGKTSLVAWIEGEIEGKKMKMDFAYQRKNLSN